MIAIIARANQDIAPQDNFLIMKPNLRQNGNPSGYKNVRTDVEVLLVVNNFGHVGVLSLHSCFLTTPIVVSTVLTAEKSTGLGAFAPKHPREDLPTQLCC